MKFLALCFTLFVSFHTFAETPIGRKCQSATQCQDGKWCNMTCALYDKDLSQCVIYSIRTYLTNIDENIAKFIEKN